MLVGAAALAAVLSGVWPDLVLATIVKPLQGFGYSFYQDTLAAWPFWTQDPAVRAQPLAYLPAVVLDVAMMPLMGSDVYQHTAVVDVLLRIVFHLPPVLLVLAVVSTAWRRFRGVPLDPREVLVLLLAASFLFAFNKPRDWIHLLVLYPPPLLLVSMLASRAVAAAGRGRRVLTIAFGVALGVLFAIAVGLAVALVRVNPVPIHGVRGTVYATAPQAHAVQSIVDAVEAMPPDLPVLSLPYHPGINYLTGRPDLSRFNLVWPAEPDLGRTDAMIADLERRRDGIVVYTPTQVMHFPRFGDYAPELFAYLADHYEIAKTVGGEPGGMSFFVLERREPPRGTSLGGERLAGAGVTETRDGVERPGDRGLVHETLWPFCRAIGVGVPLGEGVSLRYRITPAPGMHLRGSFGINPDHWAHLLDAFTFTVGVEPAGKPMQTVRRETLDVARDEQARRWHELDVDLTPWAGTPVELVFRVDGAGPVALPPIFAGWCDLRLES
jgi:hypothetical protein